MKRKYAPLLIFFAFIPYSFYGKKNRSVQQRLHRLKNVVHSRETFQKLRKTVADATPQKSEHNTSQQPSSENDVHRGLRMLAEVLGLIEQKGFRKVNLRKFVEAGLTSAVPYCDAHSAFFSDYHKLTAPTKDKFPGIGVSVISKAPSDDELLITDVIEEGPSYKVGLRAGDKIVEIDAHKLRGLSTDEAVDKLKGPPSSTVNLKVIRQKKLLEFSVVREMIKNEAITSYLFKDYNIYYLSLRLFTENASEVLINCLKRGKKEKCRGMILDLRRNPGGIFETAVDMASLFINRGSLVVSTKDRNGKTVNEYKTTRDPIFDGTFPIFILQDNFSASASEIIAGCLRHYSEMQQGKEKNLMVFLIGSTTFGKGSVQLVIPISNGGALKLTTMLYYLPDGSSIQAAGVDPDFVVKPRTIPEQEMQWLKEFSGNERSLKHHITRTEVEHPGTPFDPKETVTKVAAPQPELSWEEKHKRALNQDTHIQTAVSMINHLATVRSYAPQLVNTRKKALAFLRKNHLTDTGCNLVKMRN